MNTGGPESAGKKDRYIVKATVRRIVEMSKRVLSFSQAHANSSEGYAAALARLEKGVAEAAALADRQEQGITAARQATGAKRILRRKIRRSMLFLLARVAESAAAEV